MDLRNGQKFQNTLKEELKMLLRIDIHSLFKNKEKFLKININQN